MTLLQIFKKKTSLVHPYPESEGPDLHEALQGEQSGQRGVHVVQGDLVGLRLLVVLMTAGEEEEKERCRLRLTASYEREQHIVLSGTG